MSSNVINIQTYDYNNDMEGNKMKLNKKNEYEYTVFIDSNILPFNQSRLKLELNRKIFLKGVFVREFIVEINSENIDFFTSSKFLVLRMKEFSIANNNIVYNTSNINSDTDFIVDKTNFIQPYLTFESKYIFSIQNDIKQLNLLNIEIFNDHMDPVPDVFLKNVFIDLKLSVNV